MDAPRFSHGMTMMMVQSSGPSAGHENMFTTSASDACAMAPSALTWDLQAPSAPDPSPTPPPTPIPTTIVAPAQVVVPIPLDALVGQRRTFIYHSLVFSYVVPSDAVGGATIQVAVTVANWKEAKSKAAREAREKAARERAAAAARRRAEREQREVRTVLDSLIRTVEAEEREVRNVLGGIIGMLEAEERQRRAEEREAERMTREVSRVVERLVGAVIRIVDPRYAGLNEPEYARRQLEGLDSYLVSLGGLPNLVSNWRIRVDVRQTGGSAGETDLYFFDEAGRKFRSRLEVARHFGIALPTDKRKRRLLMAPDHVSEGAVAGGDPLLLSAPPAAARPGWDGNGLCGAPAELEGGTLHCPAHLLPSPTVTDLLMKWPVLMPPLPLASPGGSIMPSPCSAALSSASLSLSAWSPPRVIGGGSVGAWTLAPDCAAAPATDARAPVPIWPNLVDSPVPALLGTPARRTSWMPPGTPVAHMATNLRPLTFGFPSFEMGLPTVDMAAPMPQSACWGLESNARGGEKAGMAREAEDEDDEVLEVEVLEVLEVDAEDVGADEEVEVEVEVEVEDEGEGDEVEADGAVEGAGAAADVVEALAVEEVDEQVEEARTEDDVGEVMLIDVVEAMRSADAEQIGANHDAGGHTRTEARFTFTEVSSTSNAAPTSGSGGSLGEAERGHTNLGRAAKRHRPSWASLAPSVRPTKRHVPCTRRPTSVTDRHCPSPSPSPPLPCARNHLRVTSGGRTLEAEDFEAVDGSCASTSSLISAAGPSAEISGAAAGDDAACPADLRIDAEAVLRARFPGSETLLLKLLRPNGRIQCHAAKRIIPVPAHRLLVLKETGRVVAAALVHHAPPPRRQAPDQQFSEVRQQTAHAVPGHAAMHMPCTCRARAVRGRSLANARTCRLYARVQSSHPTRDAHTYITRPMAVLTPRYTVGCPILAGAAVCGGQVGRASRLGACYGCLRQVLLPESWLPSTTDHVEPQSLLAPPSLSL